jgi:hypothetical protein
VIPLFQDYYHKMLEIQQCDYYIQKLAIVPDKQTYAVKIAYELCREISQTMTVKAKEKAKEKILSPSLIIFK